MMIVASLAVLSLLPYQALSLGEGVSATDKRFEAYLSLGCWKDQCIPSNQNCSRRVLESLEKKATYAGPGSSIFYNGTHGTHYKRRPDAVKKCMVAAISFGYDVFAVQDGGQCFSGANAGTAYKTEKSRDCDGLKGGPMANDVFIISPLKKCLCMMPKAHKSLPKGKLCFESEKTLNAANRTALHVAARFNEFECAKILVNSQADINAKDKDNKTPLQLAAGFNKDASHCASINVLVTMNANQTGAKPSSIKACVPDKPGTSASKTGKPYNHLGCFRDRLLNGKRALPTLEGNANVAAILTGQHYKRRDNALGKCMNAAKHLNYDVFAVQDGGQCFAAKNARIAATKYGKSTLCNSDGKGGPMANDVYEIV